MVQLRTAQSMWRRRANGYLREAPICLHHGLHSGVRLRRSDISKQMRRALGGNEHRLCRDVQGEQISRTAAIVRGAVTDDSGLPRLPASRPPSTASATRSRPRPMRSSVCCAPAACRDRAAYPTPLPVDDLCPKKEDQQTLARQCPTGRVLVFAADVSGMLPTEGISPPP